MLKDLFYAVRTMARNKAVAAVAIITLALGIGANTAMFSVINAVLLRPLPYKDPGRLVTIWAGIPRLNVPLAFVEYTTYADWWRAQSRSYESMFAYTPGSANLTSNGDPERIDLMRVGAGFLSVLGLRPALGRDFTFEEDQAGAPRVAMLSDGLWKRRFGADRGVIGRTLVLDQNSYTITGVMPPGVGLFERADLFTPIASSTARVPGAPSVGAYARLKPGVSIRAAQTEMDGICRRWVQHSHYVEDWGARVWPLRDFLVRDVRTSVVVLAVAVGLVLLIACANVANILLARAASREREIAIRCTLGAGRMRIVRQLLTESALLAAVAGGLGLLLAWGGVRVLASSESHVPFLKNASIDLPVLCFSLGAALVTTLLFGLAPALAAARTALAENLKEGGRGGTDSVRRSRVRAALVTAEVALALLLVIGAALTVRSLARLQSVDPGFRAEGVLAAYVTLPGSSYSDPGKRVSFFRAVLERLESTPGVKSAGMVSHLPFSHFKSGTGVVVEGAPAARPEDQPIVFGLMIDPKYFQTMGIRLLRGRFFTPHDGSQSLVTIINETMAKRCWPKQDALGKRFGNGRGWWVTVIGITADARNTSLADEPDGEYYLPYLNTPMPSMALVIRTGMDPLRLAPSIRAAVRELDKDLPVSGFSDLAETVTNSTAARKFSVTLLGIFAGMALLLAAVGIYGVITYMVTRQTHEFGVRMALGAGRGRIAGMVVRRAMLLACSGAGAGLAGALALTHLLRTMLFGISPNDPAVLVGGTVFLLAVAALAAYIPARRATRVDPMTALRCE